MGFDSPEFWVAVLQIIAIDIVLGGDNAVVIALACRRLPEEQRNRVIFWGCIWRDCNTCGADFLCIKFIGNAVFEDCGRGVAAVDRCQTIAA